MIRLLKTKDAAEYLGMSERTLRNWHYLSTGPKVTQLGRAIRYDIKDLDVWIETQKENATKTK
jgi:predicted DNA-binding transcriptional regulator AlpA